MTKKQTEEMDRLADSHRPYLTKESFFAGYRAAQQPEQLILNKHVKALVEAIKYMEECLERRDEQFVVLNSLIFKNTSEALKPFQSLGGEGE